MIGTKAARDVLARCEYLLGELKAKPTGIGWEAKMSGTIALLRSFGHVLSKVYAPASSAAKAEIDKWWAEIKLSKPKPEIFWGFIDTERNLILKEGKLRAGQSAFVELVGVCANAAAGGFTDAERNAASPGRIVVGAPRNKAAEQTAPPEPAVHSPKARYEYHMNDGPFKGHDPHDLIAKALQWWRDQLDLIDSRIS